MNNKKSKIVKRILSISWWIAVALLAILLVSVIGAKLQGKVPNILGYSVMQIMTGSMEDEIPTGSYILVRKCDPDDIKENDIISFYSKDPMIYGLPNTHRVVGINETESGLEFVTRGDANSVNDEFTAHDEDLIGIFVTRLDGLTSFTEMLSGNGMFIMLIVLQFATIAIVAVSMVKKNSTKYQTEENNDQSDDPPQE